MAEWLRRKNMEFLNRRYDILMSSSILSSRRIRMITWVWREPCQETNSSLWSGELSRRSHIQCFNAVPSSLTRILGRWRWLIWDGNGLKWQLRLYQKEKLNSLKWTFSSFIYSGSIRGRGTVVSARGCGWLIYTWKWAWVATTSPRADEQVGPRPLVFFAFPASFLLEALKGRIWHKFEYRLRLCPK